MECQECHQNPASLHFTKIVNGQKTEMHLCEQCAREKGEMISGAGGFSINSLLAGLLNLDYPFAGSPSTNNSLENIQTLQCDHCGMSFHHFSKVGRFGCSSCYETFSAKIDPILRRVHSGNTTHTGKIPKRIGGHLHITKEITDLKQQLHACIVKEEFENAAKIRDRIRSLEQVLNEHGEGEQ